MDRSRTGARANYNSFMLDDAMTAAVRKVLIDHWDPHNVAERPEAHGTYDTYVDRLVPLLRGGAGEEEMMTFLFERERESMCFPALGKERLRHVARMLVRLGRG